MVNLTLYSTSAVLLLDANDGGRIICKYYTPPHAPASKEAGASAPLSTLKEQRAFEKAVWEKTRRGGGDIILYDSHLLLFRALPDVLLYVVAPAGENELMLSSLLTTLHDAITQLLPHGAIEKRALLENLDLVALAIDEAVDDGIILEMDAHTIASRVSRPRPDVESVVQINEQSLLSAYSSLKERVAQRILQGGL